jgi:hypothetical protein
MGFAVPIPTMPLLATVSIGAVDEPIANAGPEMPLGFTESWLHGVVEPIPAPNQLQCYFHKTEGNSQNWVTLYKR